MQNENGSPKKSLLSAQVDLSKFDSSYFRAATEEEKKQQDVMSESTTFFKDGIRRLKKNPLAMGSLVVLILILLIIIIAPHIVPYSYDQIITVNGVRDKSAKNLGMMEYSPRELQYMEETGEKLFPHIFGTDSLCRDYFIRVIYGTRVSLAVGLVASIMVLIIGLLYGAIAGYCGGKVDMVMMRIVDVIYSLPDMLVIILLSVSIKDVLTNGPLAGSAVAKLGSGMVSIFVVFGLLYWVGMARLVRGQVLSIKKQEFVLAAQAIGAKPSRIIRKHMLPNCISVIFISAALQIPSAIFTESFLSFLGLGVSIPMPSLGSLAADARSQMIIRPYLLIVTALAIFLIILSLNLLGNGLRDAFDPKLKEE